MDDFKWILENEIFSGLDEDDYAQAAESALQHLKQGHIQDAYRPYLEYIKLFADSYRVWQISYDYSQIRNGFELASYLLAHHLTDFFHGKLPEEHRILVEAFGNLTRMLCEYTRCENSLITNDPSALFEHSRNALNEEMSALRLLRGSGSFKDKLLGEIAGWLSRYFKKNSYLHSGLNACAEIYSRIFNDHYCPPKLYQQRIKQAEDALGKLQPESSELASELNAHIEHIKKHYTRIVSGGANFTHLDMKEGSVVLCLSGTCLIGLARDVIERDNKEFWDELRTEFKRIGLELKDEDRQELKLHDIFQTSFGEHYLKSFSVDLPDTLLTFQGNRTFRFRTSIVISAFGVCTVKFVLDVPESEDDEDDGMPVEIIRALQSCICPHAGQTRIEMDVNGDNAVSYKESAIDKLFIRRIPSNKFINQFDVVGFLNILGRIKEFIKSRSPNSFDENFLNAIKSIDKKTDEIAREMVADPLMVDHVFKTVDQEKYANEFLFILESLIGMAQKSASAGTRDSNLESIILSLAAVSNSFSYLRDLVEYYLNAVGRAFLALVKKKPELREFLIPNIAKGSYDENELPKDDALSYRHDTGWYTYIYAKSVEAVTKDGKAREVSFDEILEHPDTRGFVIEQREARASFDDWRFMKTFPKSDGDENLAYIRSHSTDAFFATEYQSFIYLRDDPRFLTDQYEATIELMIRLVSAIKFYSRVADESSHKMRDHFDHKEPSEHFADRLEQDYKDLRHIRWLSKELQILVSKASISRYKDHGDLMLRLVQNMKMDRIIGVLERHWENIDQMYSQKLNEKQSKISDRLIVNEKKSRRNIELLTFVVASTAIPVLVEHFFKFKPSEPFSKDSIMVMITFTLISLAVLFVLREYRRIRRQEEDILNQKKDKDINITMGL